MPCYIIVYQRSKVNFKTCIIPIIFVIMLYIRLSALQKTKNKDGAREKNSHYQFEFPRQCIVQKNALSLTQAPMANSGNLSTNEREPPGCPVLLHTISKTIPTQQNRRFCQIQNPGSTLNTKAYTHIMNYLQNKARMV